MGPDMRVRSRVLRMDWDMFTSLTSLLTRCSLSIPVAGSLRSSHMRKT
ncbi:uncharacterized protein G2W53_032633 [Senna tora]|uniref:Uncharacterized protein n=1 Tax=Senna tora TaxID=362788 RepID=A0A834W751_9FABA|nr:uncharacterized protein G2W53_032633 [Senna tora]